MNVLLTGDTLRGFLPSVLIFIATTALAVAYTVEYVYGFDPCTLCLYQRVPFAIVGALGIAGYIFNSDKSKILITMMAGLLFLANSGIAFHHVGVEQHWWTTVASCGASKPSQMLSMSEFQALLQQKPEIACDDITWNLFGISMATYNAAFSLGFSLGSLWTANRMRRL